MYGVILWTVYRKKEIKSFGINYVIIFFSYIHNVKIFLNELCIKFVKYHVHILVHINCES